jgi:hypothetical protein
VAIDHQETLTQIVIRKPDDYTPYGQDERWANPALDYADCSCGCRHYFLLANRDGQELGYDWGVCANPESHRCALLTFEHQGCHQFELSPEHANG